MQFRNYWTIWWEMENHYYLKMQTLGLHHTLARKSVYTRNLQLVPIRYHLRSCIRIYKYENYWLHTAGSLKMPTISEPVQSSILLLALASIVPALYRVRWLITMFIRAHRWTLPEPHKPGINITHLPKINFNIILPTTHSSPKWFLISDYHTKMSGAFIIP
jgi:hypothetical protein